ncbi:MAG: PQQ-dependent sugar dehydrogenase [Nitrospirae bacterium]|nr:PQQ-dependent sugar dehydrogenase [Nitrospirota bacterium]
MRLLTGKIFSVFFIILFSLLFLSSTFAGTLPSGFTEANVVTGLSSPVGMAFMPDGRILVIEQAGVIKVVSNSTATTLLTVTGITTGGERGLLGIAVDPDFSTRPYIYVYYTAATSPNYAQVARYTFSNNSIDPNSKLILINDIPDSASNHNGGTLRFGLDKTLYISVGDDASSCDAQNRTLLKGNILRIKVDASINPADRVTLAPANNPFVSATNNNEKIVFAYGLRNPFRFNVHPDTGALFIGDVGQSTREEVDISTGGENFGWPYWEGSGATGTTNCGGLNGTMPIYDYTRGASASVIGGVVYKGVNYPNDASLPPEFNGNFFFNDYYTGNLRVLRQNSGIWGLVTTGVDATNFGTGFSYVSDWAVGPDGAIYYVYQGGSRLVRIAYSQGPTILTTSLLNGTVGASYNQTIQATGGVQPYTWSITNGLLPNGLTLNSSTGNISGTPTAQGTFTFTIQVADANNQINSRQFSLTINPQPASLTIITSSLPSGTIGYAYNATLQATGQNTVLPYTWSLQSGALPAGLTVSNSGNDGVISGTPTESGAFNITIRVRDNANPQNSATRNFTLSINKVQITINSLSDATVGTAYYIDLSAGAANLPTQAVWEVTNGTLPTGMMLEAIGHFEGTPTQAGTYTFTIRVSETGNSQNSDSRAYTLTINSAPANGGGGSGGDSSAGGGCGFVKDSNGKGQRAKGEGLSFAVMLIITLIIVYLIRRSKVIRRFYDDTTNKA